MTTEERKASRIWYTSVGVASVFFAVTVLISTRQIIKTLSGDDAATEQVSGQGAAVPTIKETGPDAETDDILTAAAVTEESAPQPNCGYGDFEFRNTLVEHMARQADDLKKAAYENAQLPEEERNGQVLTPERIQALQDSGRMIN